MNEIGDCMKRFLLSILIFVFAIYISITGVNYCVDPANLFHESVVGDMVEALSKGNIIESPGDVDEGQLLEGMVLSLEDAPELLILGSSRVMYLPWEQVNENPFLGGLSGAFLGDYYAVTGIFESSGKLPKNIVIGIDPWAFYTDALSGRHVSINEYAKFEKELVDGGRSDREPNINANRWRKIRELFAVSYFQASVKNVYARVRSEGIRALASPERRKIATVSDDAVGEMAKILPSGRRVMAKEGFISVEENDATAKQMISEQSVYQLGSGFSELNYDYLQEFENLIDHLRKKGIGVEFYLPSWYPLIYDYFCKNPDYSGVMKLEAYIRELAIEKSITVHGSYDPYICGIVKEDYADWLHLKAEKMLENYRFVKE